jgi:hypothetical protein
VNVSSRLKTPLNIMDLIFMIFTIFKNKRMKCSKREDLLSEKPDQKIMMIKIKIFLRMIKSIAYFLIRHLIYHSNIQLCKLQTLMIGLRYKSSQLRQSVFLLQYQFKIFLCNFREIRFIFDKYTNAMFTIQINF